jgi:HD-GYP domain-containing protein (c-di-GMP phosphodiesterase class II)
MKNDRKGSAIKFSPISISEESIAGYVAKTGKILNIPDAYDIASNSPFRFNQSFDSISGYRTKAMLTVPLRTSVGKIVGVLQLINPIDNEGQPRIFREDDEKMIGHFESAATVALERAALTRSLINRMLKMAELRDPRETDVHCDRVAGYSVILYQGWAKRHGIQGLDMERERDVLRIAARLHDVGKVGISDVILKKPGRLTAEEYSAMKEHTVFGARLFGGNESVLDPAAIDVTLHHHERWDGGGYPGAPPSSGLGLKGEDIPLFARIVSVADVFDALSSKRMYKEAWPEDRVLAEMKVNAGKQFDPELIDILFEKIEEIRAASARYKTAEV